MNEAEAIGEVLGEVSSALEGIESEIIVVDDSPDEATADVVRTRAAENSRIRLLRRTGRRGLASAAIAGWDESSGELLAIIDGDGQHEAAKLRDLVQLMARTGAEVAVASRFRPDTTTGLKGRRHVLSCAGSALVHAVLGVKTSDPLAGFFIQRREWYEAVRPRLSGIGFKILLDVLASGKRRPRVVEVSTALRSRLGGTSKLDLRIIAELAALLVEKRTHGLIPARFALFAGVGATGVIVHLGVLSLVETGGGAPFWQAQALAIALAMTWNYGLNNLLTFRDLRLRGAAFWKGLFAFILACSSGALLSETVGSGLTRAGIHWLAAGACGAIAGALWNYSVASRSAWGVSGGQRRQGDGRTASKRPSALHPAMS